MSLKPVELDSGSRDHAPATDAVELDASAKPALPQFIRLHFKRLAIGAVTLVVLLGAGNWLINGRYEITTDNAAIQADIANIATKIQGYVKTVHVEDNQAVKAGDLLVTLYADDYEAGLAEAQAALSQAIADAAESNAQIAAREAAVATARGESASRRDLLAESQAAVDAAMATADLSSADAERYAELASKGWYPQARVESAEASQKSTRAQLAQAMAAVTSRQSQLASAEAHVRQAQQELAAATASNAASDARIDAARARVTAAQLRVDQSKMLAPFDGIATNRSIAPGELLSAGQIALSVVPSQAAYIVANFKETQVRRMVPGQHVTIKVDAYPGLKVTGRIDSISPATGGTFSLFPQDTATGNFTKIVQRVPVRIAIDKEALETGKMLPGLAVVATVSTKPIRD